MLDFFHIPSNTDNTRIFYVNDTNIWQTWTKPRGAKFVQIFTVGGGGGGGGARGASTGNRFGGGGGASGQITNVICPAQMLPDQLYVRVGAGGAGGNGGTNANGSNGTAGQASYVAVGPTASFVSQSLISIASGGNGGGGGSSTVGGTAGTSSPASSSANATFMSIGVFTSHPTAVGAAGSALGTVSGSSQTALISGSLTGGAGGGAASSGGGRVNLAPHTLLSEVNGSSAITANNTTNSPGESGYGLLMPFCGTGGAGGGGNNATTGSIGGRGGNGWYGCGGGGGGAAGTTGGAGGRGGDGLVIITTIS